MLEAYLQDTDDFPKKLHYCNVLYETLPMILNGSHLRGEKGASKLAVISVYAAGYGGDMDEELANDLLDDLDFDRYGKVRCSKIEGMLPKLIKMVEGRDEKYGINSMGETFEHSNYRDGRCNIATYETMILM